jgi:hypothetical protein
LIAGSAADFEQVDKVRVQAVAATGDQLVEG